MEKEEVKICIRKHDGSYMHFKLLRTEALKLQDDVRRKCEDEETRITLLGDGTLNILRPVDISSIQIIG